MTEVPVPVPARAVAGPVRTCLGCRRRDDQAALVRVVAEGAVVRVDPRRRAPGRGAYVHPDPACVAAAVKRRAFARALRTSLDAAAAGAAVTAHLTALGDTVRSG